MKTECPKKRELELMSSGDPSGRNDGDDLSPLPFVFELDHARDPGEEGVILADTHVGSRLDRRAPLTDDDRSGIDLLAAETLDAQSLRLAVPAVAGRSSCFFVRHDLLFGRAAVSPDAFFFGAALSLAGALGAAGSFFAVFTVFFAGTTGTSGTEGWAVILPISSSSFGTAVVSGKIFSIRTFRSS